ncbi:DNA-processing protein DprA [Chloroflexota bacterium]
MDNSTRYWIGFNLVKGIGAARTRALIDYFGSLELAWNASSTALQSAGLSPKILEALSQVKSKDRVSDVWHYVQSHNIKVLTWDDEQYFHYLKQINLPPPVLYMDGDVLEEDDWAVAIVGTRRVTAYGRQVAEELTGLLARNGITIISGLARGVDAIAHKAALDVGGRTIAVLGSGIDRIYPPEHRRLAERISKNGAVLTDYSPGTAPEAVNFPPRNRIISGLSRAVLVIEAGRRSGALITASFAADQGRDVFAVPGNIYAPQSKGTNLLIQQGATPVLGGQEILEALNLTMIGEFRAARSVLPSDAVEVQIYNLLNQEALHVDDITAQTNLPIEKISATLTLMELKGLIRQVGSMRYSSISEQSADYHPESGE